jgi:hypothetical protein
VKKEKTSRPSEESERKPYEPPRIIYREPLEAVAAACTPEGSAKGNPGACPIGPVSS